MNDCACARLEIEELYFNAFISVSELLIGTDRKIWYIDFFNFQVKTYRCTPKGKKQCHTSFEWTGFLGCKYTLLAHVQFFIHQYLQVLLQRPAINLFITQTILILWTALIKTQDLAYSLVELHVSFMSLENLLRVHLVPRPMSLIQIWNNISASMGSGRCPCPQKGHSTRWSS